MSQQPLRLKNIIVDTQLVKNIEQMKVLILVIVGIIS